MKLFYKYYLMIALPLVSCLFIIGIFLSALMYNYSISEKHASLERAATRVSEMTEELFYSHSFSREQMMRSFLSSMSTDGKIHIIVCNTNGEIILTSDRFGTGYMTATVSPDILNKTSNTEIFTATGTMGGLYGGNNYTVGLTARGDLSEPIAYVYVTTSIESVTVLMSYVRNLFTLLALIVFIFAAVVSYFIVRKMTRPIKQISTASARFARGDFSTRVPVQSSDEIGEMTQAFNNMADSLEKSEDLRRDFIANVSHELRSPMTSITGFVDGILDGTIPKEREEHYLQIVSEEVHRLSRLVSRMLEITVLQSKNVSESSSTFDFCELVGHVCKSFEKNAEEREININVEFPSHSVSITANEDSLYQAIYNLIDNALKFSMDGSQIDISVSQRGNHLTFSSKNYGSEIPKEELPFIFDRFHKADRSRSRDKSGLGLGLYIAKTIISQHNGKIKATSDDGMVEFSFTIPTQITKQV